MKKECGELLLKNILEKLFIKISLIKNKYWVTINQELKEGEKVKERYWEVLGLTEDEDQTLIKTC